MGAWNGRETTELVYYNIAGHFTDTLTGCGYLEHDQWHGACSRYYIEVKTTTGPPGASFYMTSKQYQLLSTLGKEDHCLHRLT